MHFELRPKFTDQEIVSALDLSIPEAQQLIIHKLADDWDWTKELPETFITRFSDYLRAAIETNRMRSINYGGAPKWNREYAEKCLSEGKRVNRNNFSRAGN